MKDHLKPFTEGAFKLEGGTKRASAIMPYYTISYGQDTKNGENVGNGFSKYLINDLLRGEYGYDGVVCTDWAIVDDMGEKISDFRGKCWGVETLTQPERHYKALMAGCDQFGGSFDVESILAAYKMGCDEHGADFMDKRMRQSAKRLLLNIFRLGLFENPYLDVEKTKATVKCEEFQKTGYEIQVRSQILLKNKGNVLPIAEGKKVYVPQREVPAGLDWFGKPTEAYKVYPMPKESIEKYYVVTDDPAEADFALVFMNSPDCNLGQNGYSDDDLAAGGNGYVPSSLQYAPYTANTAREVSVAGGDPLESFTNRSYRGKTHQATNSSELTRLQDAAKAMNGKPVVTVMRFDNPAVPGEWEPLSDAIVGNSGTGAEAILDIVSGRREPSGLLPFQLPKNMETVEAHCEDVPFDMECYTDSQGNTYDFAYGLNWSGVISDHRTAKYKPQK
jgi:beta-glucosidase